MALGQKPARHQGEASKPRAIISSWLSSYGPLNISDDSGSIARSALARDELLLWSLDAPRLFRLASPGRAAGFKEVLMHAKIVSRLWVCLFFVGLVSSLSRPRSSVRAFIRSRTASTLSHRTR